MARSESVIAARRERTRREQAEGYDPGTDTTKAERIASAASRGFTWPDMEEFARRRAIVKFNSPTARRFRERRAVRDVVAGMAAKWEEIRIAREAQGPETPPYERPR
jgi:hypothetical protein